MLTTLNNHYKSATWGIVTPISHHQDYLSVFINLYFLYQIPIFSMAVILNMQKPTLLKFVNLSRTLFNLKFLTYFQNVFRIRTLRIGVGWQDNIILPYCSWKSPELIPTSSILIKRKTYGYFVPICMPMFVMKNQSITACETFFSLPEWMEKEVHDIELHF